MNTPAPTHAWWKGLLGLLLAIIVTVSVAGPSMAFTGGAPQAAAVAQTAAATVPGTLPTFVDSGHDPSFKGRGVCAGTLDAHGQLPVTRWDEGTEFHDRLHGASPGDMAKRLQRQGIVSLFFSVGNTAWATTTGATEMALNFCVLDRVGGVVDRTAGSIGKALMSSGIVVALVVASIMVFAWRVGRGQGGGANTKMLLQKGLVLALFSIMIGGAMNSTGGGQGRNPNAAYSPGTGSPGWFITQIDQAVTTAAAGVTGSLISDRAIGGAEQGPKGRANLGCAPYVKAMKDVYVERQGAGVAAGGIATTPMLLSSLWENSGLEMWKRAQFGTQRIGTYGRGEATPYGYGDLMYCRMLELNVASKRHPVTNNYDVSVSSLMSRTGALDKDVFGKAVSATGKTKPVAGVSNGNTVWHTDGDYLPWRYSTSNKKKDRAYVAWAACAAPTDELGAPLVHTDDATPEDLKKACQMFFGDAGFDGGSGTGEFDWDESDDDISQTSTTDAAQDFLLTLHGNRQASGLVAGMVYMVSSLMVAGVFILFSGAIMVAKITALMMMIGVIGVLVFSLTPNASMSKITDYGKQYLGLSLFAWGAQLVICLLAFITAILVESGNAIVPGGPGGVMAVAWVGFAPVMAVFCLHFMFKKLRIPSPLKMSGGMAWGQMAASGAVGGAAGFGAGALVNRAGNRVKARAVNAGRDATSRLVGKERGSRMAPDGAPTTPTSKTTKAGSGSKTAAGTGEKPSLAAVRQERKDAKAFVQSTAGARALNDLRRASGGRLAAARSRVDNAVSQFKDRPLETAAGAMKAAPKKVAKAAGVGAGVVMLGAATGGVGLAAAGGAYAAKRALDGRKDRDAQMLRGEAGSEAVEVFRAHKAQQEARRAQQEAQHKARQDNTQQMAASIVSTAGQVAGKRRREEYQAPGGIAPVQGPAPGPGRAPASKPVAQPKMNGQSWIKPDRETADR